MQFFPSSGYFISPAFDIQTSSIYVLGAWRTKFHTHTKQVTITDLHILTFRKTSVSIATG
jgi:hypothetical protein